MVTPQISSRISPRPELAVLAVVLARGAVLLVRRRNPPDAGLWGFPGGRVEFGETVGQAAARELREETTIIAAPGPVLGQMDLIAEGFHFHLVAVLCRDPVGQPLAGDDADAAEWVALKDVFAAARPLSTGVDEVCRLALKAKPDGTN